MKIKMLLLVSIIGFYCNIALADATGLCKDGTEYTGKSKRGACRGHDGIKEWFGDKADSSDSGDDTASKSKTKKSKAKAEKAAAEEPSGPATGMCKDGTETSGKSKRGACRGHDGVKEWYADKDKEAPVEKSSAKSKSKAAADDADTAAASSAATGLCKDGTETTGKSKRGACRGHDGIKEWYADKEKEAPAAKSKAKEEPAAAASTGTATGLCKDGTEFTGASKRGACRGHKGLKEWYADSEESETEIAAPPAKSASSTNKAEASEPPTRKAKAAPAAGSGQVWVNTNSKIYHCEDSRFYGNTKEGEYMSEGEAKDKGYRANRRQACN